MNHFWDCMDKTGVKIFFVILLLVSFVERVSAENSAAAPSISLGPENPGRLDYDKARAQKSDCKDARKVVSDANTAIGKACQKAGLGKPDVCVKQAMECGEISGSDTYSSNTQILSQLSQLSTNPMAQTLGSAIGTVGANSDVNSACPQMNGRDYFTENDRINKDLKDNKKDLADLNEEKTKIQDEFNKTVQDLQDDLTKAQQDLESKKLELKEKNRQQLASFQENQQKQKDQLRTISTQVLNLRGQLIMSQQDQALKLIAMTDASGKRACMKAVNEAKKAYLAIASSTNGNYISQAKQKKQDLIAVYNDCMDQFLLQRDALNKSKKQEQDQINKALSDQTQQSEELTNAMSSASAQLAEIQKDAKDEGDQATQKVATLMQTNQNKMLAAQQKMQGNLQTLATKEQNLAQEQNRLNNSLLTLGPKPKSRGDEYTPAAASSEISGLVDDALSAMNDSDNAACFSGVAYKDQKTKFEKYHTVQ